MNVCKNLCGLRLGKDRAAGFCNQYLVVALPLVIVVCSLREVKGLYAGITVNC